MLLSTTESLPGYQILKTLGPVYGTVCVPLVTAGSKEPPETFYSLAISEAVSKMEQQARSLYEQTANVILNIRISPCAVPNLSYLLLIVVGTAAAASVQEASDKNHSDPITTKPDDAGLDDASSEKEIKTEKKKKHNKKSHKPKKKNKNKKDKEAKNDGREETS